ncbi:hypothetical protein [Flectobacillus major]|jgi:hypothetical protein|uniref:hypothetical protein n=1 Tax=Flectobacillus major TaxID=103 RepID=UPI00040AC399|nr:hypothetical protein [Flectobacillus major]
MKKFIPITVGNYLIVHGYDANNQEIVESVKVEKPALKLVAVERIQSVSKQYVLVSSAFGRQMYWEYEESFDTIQELLASC